MGKRVLVTASDHPVATWAAHLEKTYHQVSGNTVAGSSFA